MSFPAAIGDGTGCGSNTVTYLYPRRTRWSAVEQPQVPAPTMSIEDEGLRPEGVIMAAAK